MIEAINAKHGVLVREHNNWNTKTIYNNGHVMRIYRHQPKTIHFRSPMVNDFNQHLCGGWSISDIKDENEATIRQLMAGKKAFACISFWNNQEASAVEAHKRLMSSGLVTDLRNRSVPGHPGIYVWDLLVCHDMRVQDIGDLQALREDYAEIFEMGLERKEVMPFADRALPSFFDGWDSPPLPFWLTGLILGYPVENTISLYLE